MIPLAMASLALLMMAIERFWPGRELPAVPGWFLRALVASGLQALAVWWAGVTWDPWMAAHRAWSSDRVGTAAGALLGYVAITFVYYWWHRARHEARWLWRWLHQLHHSPQRIEVVTSFYKHPLEIAVNSVLSSTTLHLLVGVTTEAATFAVLMTGVAELFYHWNVRTPHWLGYIVQRPESHRVHHERDRHGHNYSDLPLWDFLFGTLHNPRTDVTATGFSPEQEACIAEMLLGRDLLAERPSSRR